jgi:hypothetical protein
VDVACEFATKLICQDQFHLRESILEQEDDRGLNAPPVCAYGSGT